MSEKTVDLNRLYRPKTLDEVIGQDSVVEVLGTMIRKKRIPQSIIFWGPPGTGKTTLARIIARELKCKKDNILEINAANYNGVDAMRDLTRFLDYPTLGSNPLKVIILDEIQRLTGNAFDALLKPLEDPPSHVYVIACTTEFNKIPRTIQRRCTRFKLELLEPDDIVKILLIVSEKEDISLSDDAINIIARTANGCPADALSYLSQVRYYKKTSEVREFLESYTQDKEVKSLSKFVASDRHGWKELLKILNDLKGKNPESIRIEVSNYLTACVLNAKSEKAMIEFSRRLECFSKQITNNQAFYEIILDAMDAIGKVE